MKLIRAVKRTKLARQILRAPIILITVVLSALLGLSSCGGGESVKSNGDKMMVMPPPGDSRSEHSRGVFVYEQSAGCGLDVGVATGYAGDDIETLERVFFAAYEQCELTGAQNCSGSEGFGTIYGVNCAAIAHGFSGGRCVTESYDGETVSNARRDALSACRDKLGADCEIVLTDCSTTSNEQSYRRTFVARDNSGGSDGSGSDGNSVGAFVYAQTAGCGLGVGVATGYSADDGSAVNNEAIRQCQLTGAQNCGNVGHAFFGTAIGESCAAIAHGSSGGLCATAPHYGESVLSARRDALSDCRNKLGADCEIVLTACSTTSNKQSYHRTFSGNPNPGGNSAPKAVTGFSDTTVSQGRSVTWDNVSSHFTDPDGDRLTITARSNHRYATARISGGDLIVTGVTAFTSGAVTVTVTATDPGGLSVSQSFSVKVTGSGSSGNSAPKAVTGFSDTTVSQGRSVTWDNVSSHFTDPDGDRLTITARSNHRYATARISGGDLIVTGVTAFTSGAVTVTVTATDPGGLSVSQSFSVKVTGSGSGGRNTNTGPPKIKFVTNDVCNDGRDVNMRFSYNDSSKRFINWATGIKISGGADTSTTVSCNYSNVDYVCWGARIQGTRTYFGQDIDGSESCETCCVACPTNGEKQQPVNFGC